MLSCYREQTQISNARRDIVRIPLELTDRIAWLQRMQRVVEAEQNRIRGTRYSNVMEVAFRLAPLVKFRTSLSV